MSPGSLINVINKMNLQIIYLIYTYKKDLALNNQQKLIFNKTKQNKTKPKVYLVHGPKKNLIVRFQF